MKQTILSITFLFSVSLCFSQKVKGDTLEIVNKQIKYIKVDGVVYEIKRSITIEPVEKGTFIWLNTNVDSLIWRNNYIYDRFNYLTIPTSKN